MEANKILNADIIDLIFDGRNKDYGAYDLRRTYYERVLRALVVTASVGILVMLGSITAKTFQTKNNKGYKVREITLQEIKAAKAEEKKPEVPPTPPKPPPEPKVAMAKFTPPKIVKDEEVKEVIQENRQLEEKKIDVVNQEGVKDENIATPTQIIDQGKKVIVERKNEEENKIFEKVEIEAQFPGGDPAWYKFLERNLHADVVAENGAPPGSYIVWVQFVVDMEGNVSDVKALTRNGYGMEDEAMRVIKKGPQWKPAIQNGRNVKAYRKQPITFLIEEGQ
ncbi:MAG: energy transducer TonB [Chitinophagales bacterium]